MSLAGSASLRSIAAISSSVIRAQLEPSAPGSKWDQQRGTNYIENAALLVSDGIDYACDYASFTQIAGADDATNGQSVAVLEVQVICGCKYDESKATVESQFAFVAYLPPSGEGVVRVEDSPYTESALRCSCPAAFCRNSAARRRLYAAGQRSRGRRSATPCRNVLKTAWPRIEGKTALTLTELEQADESAMQLMLALAHQKKPLKELARVAELRQRAVTLFANAYTHARRAVQPPRIRPRARHQRFESS